LLTPKESSTPNNSTTTTQLPDLQSIAQKIISLVDKKREKLFSGLSQVKEKEGELNTLKDKMSFDLQWKFELSNLFIGFKDKNSPDQCKGSLNITNSFQINQMCDKFLELEKQLIDSKINLANQGSQVEEVQFREDHLKKQKRELDDKVHKLEAEIQKQAKDFKAMENNYISTKLKHSQLEMDFQNLQQELQQLKKKK